MSILLDLRPLRVSGCSVGTGGTLSGVGIALRERKRDVQIYLADPMGSGIYSWYARGEWKPEGNSITEGIGNNHELGNIVGFRPDGQYQITDAEMLPVLFALVEEEDMVLGGSTGINICGAIQLAKEMLYRRPAVARDAGSFFYI